MFNFMKKNTGSHNNGVNNGSSSGYGSQGSSNNQTEEKEQRKKMKKIRKEKEKKEKGSFSMSSDDLLRLDEVRKSLKLRSRRKEKEKLPSGITADYSANFFAPLNRDETDDSTNTPPLPPRRGILKPPPILEHGPIQDLDSDSLLQTNTLKNELIVYENVPRVSSIDSLTDSTTNSSFATPFNLSPSGNEYLTDEFDENLKLPCVPMIKVEPRVLTINRRAGPGSDFGFSLRRGLVSEKTSKNLKPVIFAEPGQDKLHYTGLLPGDKLLEVNGSPVSEKNRDEIIDMIKSSETSITVKVEPAMELYELSNSYLNSQITENDLTTSRTDVEFSDLPQDLEVQDSSEAYWLVHTDGFSPVQYCNKKGPDGNGRVLVKVFGGKEYSVDEDSLEKMNPMKMQMVDDLSQLNFMNESSILNVARSRYASNLIHTYSGPTMMIVNPGTPLNLYTDKVMDMVKNLHKINKQPPPHVYAMAQSVYKSAVTTRRDQSLIPMGCQASGKTTSCKHILQYLLKIAASPNRVVTLERIEALWTVLEAFGNAAITNNPNATRSVQLFSIDLDQGGQIVSMSIQMHFYDKWRLIDHPPNEFSFHIFYYLLAGIENIPALRKELYLDQINDDLKGVDKAQAAVEFTSLQSAMMTLGFTNIELKAIYAVLAAIIHLGHTKIVKKDSIYKDKVQWTWSNSDAAKRAAKCLGAGNADDLFSLVFPDVESFKEYDIGDQLNALVVGLYTETFNLVASIINRKLAPSVHSLCSILIPDYPGYIVKSQSVLTMFDFWTHYLHEKLLSSYHNYAVVTPLEKYKVEKVETVASYEAEFCAEDHMLKLFVGAKGAIGFGRSSSMVDLKHEPFPGLLRILDDIASDAKSSDKDLVERINNLTKEKSFSNILKKGNRSDEFVLVHFREAIPSTYSINGWTNMCRDCMSKTAIGLLHDSSNIDISTVFSKSRGAGLTSTLAIVDGTQSLRRMSSIRRATFGSLNTTATLKRKLTSVQIRFSVDGLIETLRRTGQHYVHCFIAKCDAGHTNRTDVAATRVFHSAYKLTSATLSPVTNKPNTDVVDIPLLRKQMRGADILPTIRFYKQGYPISMFIVEFVRKFAVFLPNGLKTDDVNGTFKDQRQSVTEIMSKADLDESLYKVGLNQIFFRAGVLQTLESQRDEKLSGIVIQLQAQCRGYLARKDYAKRKVNDIAIRCIQRNVKKFMVVRDWPWWRLLVRITPLLNVHRTEYELKQKSDELDQLRTRVDKLEQERSQLKNDNERLEQRLAETNADLAEEHSTVTMVSERLEFESAERQRLEKELQEVQAVKTRLAETNEQLEMQLLCMRSTDPSLMSSSSSVAGTMSDDDSAVATSDKGDQYYRRRYERVCRELDYAKKRLHQQHNDDMEQLMAMKKQLEKKLAGVYEDVEEQRQIVAQWKRKVNKLNSESNDLKLMLEESNSRNNLLEKKQKKFDTELHSLQEELKKEKAQREKITRERDMAISDKFAMEQNLSSAKLELELKEQKVTGLNRELQELTFSGNTEEEVAALKRSKHQLESKLKDQEEELDDLAGQVQLLEQVKTRLEMGLEQERKEHRRELAQREQENEETRCSAAKKKSKRWNAKLKTNTKNAPP